MTSGSGGARRGAALALLLGVFVVGLRAPLMDLPLERDEGGYAYIAWRLTEGETPYLDWFDQKPPGIFLVYAAALALPGDPVLAIRLVAALFCAASALALFALVRRLVGDAAGLLAAVLLAWLSADPMLQGPVANTELFMTPWILLASLLSLRIFGAARPPVAASLAVGLALGVASAFKQVAVVNAPFLILLYGLRAPRTGSLGNTARFALWLGAGGALVWAAILLGFWLRDGLGPALDAVLLHNLDYAARLTLDQRLGQLRHFLPPLLPSQGVAWGIALVGGIVLARRDDRFPAIFLIGLAVANAVGVSASGLYFPHYFQQLLPALAALAAAAIVGVAPQLGMARRVAIGGGTALALAPLVVSAVGFWRLDPAEATQRIYPGSVFETMPVIAEEIASLTEPEDSVFIFGAEPEILFYARRISASRYIYLFPLFGDFPDAEARQAGVIREIDEARPEVIVWIPNQMFFAPDTPQELTGWTWNTIDTAYFLHAFVVPDAESRGTLRRVEPGSNSREVIGSGRPWATIFRRAASAAEPEEGAAP